MNTSVPDGNRLQSPSEADQTILRKRARDLAREIKIETIENGLELVVFTLASERYAVETCLVEESFRLEELTVLPGVPSFIGGIVNRRGTMLALVNIKKLFALPESGIADMHQIIVIRNKSVQMGLLADTLEGVITIPQADLQATLPTLTGLHADYLRGVHSSGLVVLDGEKLLTHERLTVNQKTA